MTHLVKKGETLGSIALDLFGDASRWTDLWECNNDIIVKEALRRGVPFCQTGPDLIFEGTELRLPRPMTGFLPTLTKAQLNQLGFSPRRSRAGG